MGISRSTTIRTAFIVSLLLGGAAFGLVGVGVPGARVSAASPPGVEPQQAPTISYEFYDFFDVPYGEWWDYRYGTYGDLPINAECFSAAAIANGVCTPSNAAVDDTSSYPYTDWYPLPGAIRPDNPNVNPMIYAPFRMRITGMDVGGYDLSDPVFLPVLNAAQAPGSRLEFNWYMQYFDTATANARSAAGCPISARVLDGFQIRSEVTLVMDLQESRRIFGVVGANAAAARTWWQSNTDPTCLGLGAAELALEDWFVLLGGDQFGPGKYDIANSFEYYYTPFYTQMSATVDDAGVTTVRIEHAAWGTEVLLARMFYWGRTSYEVHHLDSTQAAGWWGMELAWFEDFQFAGSLAASNFDFTLASVMQYQFQALGAPGADGLYNQVGDISYWTWGPILTDYTNDWSPRHTISELDRYPTATYVHATPGGRTYGQSRIYDFPPSTWDLAARESWHFQFPTRPVVFYDPNLTPLGTNPVTGRYVEIHAMMELFRTHPASYGSWNAAARTWDVVGPSSTGGPVGSPGPDGLPGTADDQYALVSWGRIELRASTQPALLRVTTNPAVPGKINIDGYPADEWGLTWVKVAQGAHTVSFGDLYGLGTPAAQAVMTANGATTVVVGNYAVFGSLRVTTEPAVPGTISVNGQAANDWGMWRAAPAGTYTVSFGAVAGFTPPAPVTATVTAGALTHVIGRYTSSPGAPGPDPSTFGLLRVTTNPAVPSSILVNGIARDEWGLTWVKMAPGTYTVSFKGVYGVTPPAPATVTVTAGATTVYDGVFVVHGSLRVITNPAVPATIFVDGLPRNDWGMWQSMPPGTYTVSFEPLAGFTSPAAQTATVAAGVLTTVTGAYTVSVTPDVVPAETTVLADMAEGIVANVARGSNRE